MKRLYLDLTINKSLRKLIISLGPVALIFLAVLASYSSWPSTVFSQSGFSRENVSRSKLRKSYVQASALPLLAENTGEVKAFQAYGRLPLSFEANKGQADSRVSFLARGQGYGLFLTPTEAVLSLKATPNQQVNPAASTSNEAILKTQPEKHAILSLRLKNAKPSSRITGIDESPGTVNYFIGNDPTKWRSGVPTYAKVRYENVYPGIDMVYYGNQQQLEYDFVIAPHRDAGRVKLEFNGADKLKTDQNGDLVLSTAGGEIYQRKPIAYQEIDGERREIAARYRIEGHKVGFEIGAYDRSQLLIVDPVLVYSTFLGGSDFEDGLGIAVDAQGNAYLTGGTGSTDFPTANPFQGTNNDLEDAYVVKLNSAGTQLIYATYLGGNGAPSNYEMRK